MPIFSFFLIGYLFYLLIRYRSFTLIIDKIFILICFWEMNSISGYFCKLGNLEIEYSEFLIGILIVLSLYTLNSVTINRRSMFLYFLFFISCLLGILHSLLFPYQDKIIDYSVGWDSYIFGLTSKVDATISLQSVLMLIRILIYLIILIYINKKYNEKWLEKTVHSILSLSKIQIWFLIAEFISKYFMRSNSLIELKNFILGYGDSTINYMIVRGNKVALYGLTREPSHLAAFLFYFIAFHIIIGKVKKDLVWNILALLFLFSSMSMSSVVFFVLLLFLYLIKMVVIGKNISKVIYTLIFISATVFIFAIRDSYYRLRIANALEELMNILNNNIIIKQNVTSERVRLASIFDTLKIVLDRPMFGIGIGTATCYGGLASVLSNIGIAGTVLWFVSFAMGFNPVKLSDGRQLKLYLLLVLTVFIFPNFLNGRVNMLYTMYFIPLIIACRKCIASPSH